MLIRHKADGTPYIRPYLGKDQDGKPVYQHRGAQHPPMSNHDGPRKTQERKVGRTPCARKATFDHS